MSAQSTASVIALSVLAAPATIRIAEGIEERAPSEERSCIVKDKAQVERRARGSEDIAAALAKGTAVEPLERRGDLQRIRYLRGGRKRIGWVSADALGPCEDTKPKPAPHNLTKAIQNPESGPVAPSNTPSPESDAVPEVRLHPFGAPQGAVPGGVLLRKSGYDCYHDPELRYCRWVGYCYRPEQGGKAPRKGTFFPEPGLSPGARAELADYTGSYARDLSGFDRGHLAPDAAMKAFGAKSQHDTYSLANITPQYSRTNQGIWRELEARIRGWATRDDPVCVETGPVFHPDRTVKRLRGPSKLKVPHAYFVIVTQGSGPDVISFMVPNTPEPQNIADLMADAASVDEVEIAVSFDFLPDLDDDFEDELEAAIPEELW